MYLNLSFACSDVEEWLRFWGCILICRNMKDLNTVLTENDITLFQKILTNRNKDLMCKMAPLPCFWPMISQMNIISENQITLLFIWKCHSVCSLILILSASTLRFYWPVSAKSISVANLKLHPSIMSLYNYHKRYCTSTILFQKWHIWSFFTQYKLHDMEYQLYNAI
jgi:hypothetical protein